MADALSIATSSLVAHQRSLATTGHNIANVGTEGYSRQRVDLGARQPEYFGGGFLGTGVEVQNVRRIYDEFVVSQLRDNSASYHQQEVLTSFAQQIDNFLADRQTGLDPIIQNFFNAVQDSANDPTSVAARQVLLGEATSLVARFNDFSDRLELMNRNAASSLEGMVNDVNHLSRSIAELNKQILAFGGLDSGGRAPNDLLDQRDHLINELSEYLSVTTTIQTDGSVNVFAGNGQGLVVSTTSQNLAVSQSEIDPEQFSISFGSGSNLLNVTEQLTGGKIGGLLSFRDQVLNPTFNSLGHIAMGIAETFNEQHQLGQDLNGIAGADFFNLGTPTATSYSVNTGSGSVSAAITNINGVTTSDYTLVNTGANTYDLVRKSDNQVTTINTGGAASFTTAEIDGLTFTINAGANVGDRFSIRPTRYGASDLGLAINDPREFAAAQPIRTSAQGANTGTAGISAGSVNPPAPQDPNLQQTVNIVFNNPPTTFNVTGTGTGNPTNVAYTDGGDITFNGFTVQISGTPAAGDTFVIEANTNGVGDNRNALQLAALQSSKSLNNSTTSYQDAYGLLVSDVGTKTRTATVSRDAHEVLLTQSHEARAAVSGVNLDEEAANLLRFQQAYAASAQVVSVANGLFDVILNAVGR